MRTKSISVTSIVVLTLVGVSTVVLSAFGYFSYRLKRSMRREELRAEAASTAKQVAIGVALPMWNFDKEQVEKIMQSAMADRDVYSVAVRDSGEGVLQGAFVRDGQWRVVRGE